MSVIFPALDPRRQAVLRDRDADDLPSEVRRIIVRIDELANELPSKDCLRFGWILRAIDRNGPVIRQIKDEGTDVIVVECQVDPVKKALHESCVEPELIGVLELHRAP